jgi:hypothetical protein
MARPTLPSIGEAGWGDRLNSAINQVSDTADAALAGAQSTTFPACVYVDSFPGANDDAKLAAALTYAATQDYKPAIIFGNRRYNLSQPITAFSGLRLSGGAPGSTEQVRSGNPLPGAIYTTIGSNNAWLNFPNGNTYGINIRGLSFYGTSNTRWSSPNPSSNVVTSVFDDLSFNGYKSIFGSTTVNQPFTISTFRGFWNVNNCYDQAFALGGSDCSFWETGSINLDAPEGFRPDSSDLIRFGAMSKSTVGPVYLTADRASGARISNSNAGQLIIRGMRFEGRNATNPCDGAVLLVDGNSGYTLRDCWFGYGMANPATNGRVDRGVIHITNGKGVIDGAWYGRADGVSEDVPFIYCSGGTVRVQNVMTQMGQTWGTGKKPVVVQTGTGTVYADNTVTVKDGNGNVIQL